MAHEIGEPKNLLIFGIGVGSVVTLVAVLYGLQSYYYNLRDSEQYTKVLGRSDAALVKLRDHEKRQLTTYAKLDSEGKRVRIPIEDAMTLLARRGRDAFPSIRPEANATAGSAPAPATSGAPPATSGSALPPPGGAPSGSAPRRPGAPPPPPAPSNRPAPGGGH